MKPTAFAIDLDGVIYRGPEPIPGAVEFIRTLQETDIPFCFVTNNSEHHPSHYLDKLHHLGITIEPKKLLSASQVLVDQLLRHHSEDRIYVVGTVGLQTLLVENGMTIQTDSKDGTPDLIVLGEVRSLDYDELCTVVHWAEQNIGVKATNCDRIIPNAQGLLVGCGAITQLIVEAASVKAEYFGKPSVHMAKAISQRLAMPLERVAMVGDTLETDIQLAVDHGMQSILVLSGNTQRNDLRHLDQDALWVVGSVADLIPALRAASP